MSMTADRNFPRRRALATKQRAFSLVELIAVITVIGVLAGLGAVLILQPFEGTQDIRQRARLVDAADLALSRMAREVRLALPNSVRVTSDGSRRGIEFVKTTTGGRYRRFNDPESTQDDRIKLAPESATFDVLGGLFSRSDVQTNNDTCGTSAATCMNIFNTGQRRFDVYAGDNLARITGVTPQSDPDVDHDQLRFERAPSNSTPTFRRHSPAQRFYLFDTVVSFVCDEQADELLRFAGYGLNGSQDLAPASDPALLADRVTGCSFNFDPGAPTRNGLLTITLTLTGNAGEVQLFQQIHILNAP
jgi:MSHA biogenesis protein MshO